MSLPEAASQSLAVLSALAVRIRAPSGLNATTSPISLSDKEAILWAKEAISLPEVASDWRTESLAPMLGGVVRARR